MSGPTREEAGKAVLLPLMMMKTSNTPENIAVRAYKTGAIGRFDTQFILENGIAANYGAWAVAA